MNIATTAWPSLSQSEWSGTRDALHRYLQIVGKYRLAQTPWLNHSWHATLYPNARGLTTGLIGDGERAVEVVFDFAVDQVAVETIGGGSRQISMARTSVAEFHREFRDALQQLGADTNFHGSPNEIPDPVPFDEDPGARPYDADAVRRFHRALVTIAGVFEHFRTGFVGKSSPVHLFWGSFDLAVTRFSGELAPLHPGGIPALPDAVTQEAYSHEVASAGFWPGGGLLDEACFYAYAYPTPEGFSEATLSNSGAYWHEEAGEFLLPYDAVRAADNPRQVLITFLLETFDAACDLGGWEREKLTCALGVPRRPRSLT